MKRFRSRCPIELAKDGRIKQCGTMINTTDGMCAVHWALVPIPLQRRFADAKLGTGPKRDVWARCVRAAESRATEHAERETVSADLQVSLL